MIHEKSIDLQNRIKKLIETNMPIATSKGSLSIEDLKITVPDSLDNANAQMDMKYQGKGSVMGYVKGRIVIKNAAGKIVSESNPLSLIPFYYLTERGTYLVNGSEKNILTQMRTKPGSYTEKAYDRNLVKTSISFDHKESRTPRISMYFDPLKSDFKITVHSFAGAKEYNGVGFLREYGFTDPEITRVIGNDDISDSVMRKARTVSVSDIYRSFTGKSSTETPDKTRLSLYDYLNTNARFGDGQVVIKSNLGVNTKVFTKDVLSRAVQKTFAVLRNEEEEDDMDDLRFKTVHDENDLIMERVEKDFNNFKEEAKKSLEKGQTNYAFLRLKLGDTLKQFMTQDELVQPTEQVNPLFIAATQNRITQLGDGGGISSDSARNTVKPRNIKAMGMNRIDPVETPESGKVGLVEHITQSAVLKDKTIYAPVLKVSNGEAIDTTGNTVELSPDKEHESKVAFYDSRILKKEGNKIVFTKDMVSARYLGKSTMMHVSEIQYLDKSPQNMFNYTANMIPYVSHDDGSRTLMGTNMQRQAILLKNREVPLVMTAYDKDRTYEDFVGKNFSRPVHSNVSGEVTRIEDNHIFVQDSKGKEHAHSYYNYFPLNQSFINNDVLVSPGQKINKGDMIADGWQAKNGKLALGVNARIGFLPYKGYNYEDGIVISKDFAKRMSSEEMTDKEYIIKEDWIGGRGSNSLEEFKKYTNNPTVFSTLDSDGIIKVGSKVRPGSIIAGYLIPEKQTESFDFASLFGGSSKGKYTYKSLTIEPTSYLEGEVKRVNIINSPEPGIKQKLIITLVTSKPLKLGDKLSGKHGNKGTVTKIVSDDEMPVTEDKKPLDIIFSPLAVPSRKNLGQLYEVHAGLIAEKTGKSIIVNNFNHDEKDKVIQGLKDIGYADGKMKVILKEKQPGGKMIEIPTDSKVTVGNMYIMRLRHKVDEKIQARSNVEPPGINLQYNMPEKKTGQKQGEKYNPQGFGEMEVRAMQAHGAVWNLLESTTIKADGGGDGRRRIALFNAIATGKLDNIDYPATPESLNILRDNLKALGLNMKPINNGRTAQSFDDTFDSLSLSPLKPSEMIKMIGVDNEVTNPSLFQAKMKGKEDEPISGGLADPSIFGESGSPKERTSWGYIKLGTPMPNPVLATRPSFNPYTALTGIKHEELQNLMSGKSVVIVDPEKYEGYRNEKDKQMAVTKFNANMQKLGLKVGDMVEPAHLEKMMESEGGEYNEVLWKAGGEGLQHLLDQVDIDEELKNTKEELKNAKGDKLNKVYKKYKMLLSLKNQRMTPSDLMMQYVPVTPKYLRPVIRSGKGIISNNMDKLYSNIILSNTPIKNIYENGFDMIKSANPTDAARDTASLYENLTNLSGVTTYKDKRFGREVYGIRHTLAGKEGLIRDKMLSKKVDFSGRSVIGVDPELSINEVGIPADMAKYVYKPFILRELIDRGYAKDMEEAKKKWSTLDNDTMTAMNEVAKDRPVIINRQPTLHKFNVQAYKPVIKSMQDGEAVRSIQLNPLVVTGFNADFDGDTMSLHVPITERAKEEANRLMKPSQNLINPTNGQMIIEIRHEMALGIYYLTMGWNAPEGKGAIYGNYTNLRKDYTDGKINARTKVSMMGENTTAGQAMVNFLIPEQNKKYRNFKKVWTSKDVSGLLIDLYKECEKTNGKSISLVTISRLIDDIKKLGFEAATRSGISIGITDFKKMESLDKLFEKHVKAESGKHETPEQDEIVGWQKAEKEVQDKLGKGEVLSENNSVQIMMASGARAKPDQIRRMMTNVGVGMDVTNRLISPISHSHLEGLSPQEYWQHSFDSRKGIYDRSVATSKPGEVAREVWSAVQDMIITERDCKTTDGILIKKNSSSLMGRFVCTDVVGEKGLIIKAGNIVTDDIKKKIYEDETLDQIKVRSPLKCKTVGGTCQKCYGATPNTTQLVALGTAVGVLASQALGEPITQMTLNTFHSGGTSSTAVIGLPRIVNVLDLSDPRTNKAVLANHTGKITSIKKGALGTFDTVFINDKAHKVPHLESGESRLLRVDIGDNISKGDFVTYGDLDDLNAGNKITLLNSEPGGVITAANPRELFKLKTEEIGADRALDYTQNYLAKSMEYAFDKTIGGGKIDSRHLETIVAKMTSKVQIQDAGDSEFMRGQVVDRNLVEFWNAQNTGPYHSLKVSISRSAGNVMNKKSAETLKDRKGNIIVQKGQTFNQDNIAKLILAKYDEVKIEASPIEYSPEINSKDTIVTKGHENWFSNLGHEDIYEQLAQGAVMGQVDKLEDPRSRLMAGKLLRVREGFLQPKERSNSIGSKMLNFFSNFGH